MIGKAMELSQLKMFKVIVEQGSIVKASRVLHCVPSNITNRIKLLEQELGVDPVSYTHLTLPTKA